MRIISHHHQCANHPRFCANRPISLRESYIARIIWPPRVLYELRYELCEPLHIIFTTSYNSGKLPADWRSANITAIYKKGNKKEPKNRVRIGSERTGTAFRFFF